MRMMEGCRPEDHGALVVTATERWRLGRRDLGVSALQLKE